MPSGYWLWGIYQFNFAIFMRHRVSMFAPMGYWGIVSALNAIVQTEMHFYAVRFLIGVAEAGFFPGVILNLTYWYPAERRARVTKMFISSVAIAGILGEPISGVILRECEGLWGWQAWQWLYLLEALPSVILGGVIYLFLTDRIPDAKWLSNEEKNYCYHSWSETRG